MIQTRHVTAKLIGPEGPVKLGHVSTKEVNVSTPKPEGVKPGEVIKAKTTKSVTTSDVDGLNKRVEEAASQVKEKKIIDEAIAKNKKKAAAEKRKEAAEKRKEVKT